MQKIATIRVGLLLAAALIVGLVAAFFVARSSNASSSAHRQAVVKTAKNRTLGKTILVNRQGMTLYSLSAERHGRFICTNMSCLALWKPLVVPRGTTPTGVHGLGTVRRPDRRMQVAYRGAPLYRFTEDRKPGDVKGNGFKDVGIWRPVTVGSSASTAPATPAPSGYGY